MPQYVGLQLRPIHNSQFSLDTRRKRNVLSFAPAILGVILGPIGETNLLRALMTDSDLTIFVTRPISLLFLVLALFSLIYPFFQAYRQKHLTKSKTNE